MLPGCQAGRGWHKRPLSISRLRPSVLKGTASMGWQRWLRPCQGHTELPLGTAARHCGRHRAGAKLRGALVPFSKRESGRPAAQGHNVPEKPPALEARLPRAAPQLHLPPGSYTQKS